MKQTFRIPLLKDHHNHLSFYALLHSCLNLQEVTQKKDALELLNRLDNKNAHQGVNVVLGWNSGYYSFDNRELATLPPIIIVNISLHEFLITSSAEEVLKPRYPDIIANYKDPQWFEDNMPRMLLFLSQLVAPNEEKFQVFFDAMLKKGVYYIEEMHLPGDQVWKILQSSPFAHRATYWTTPETFQELSPDTRAAVKGLKFFTDGAVGARTAALASPYPDGSEGYLLYDDKSLYNQLSEVSLLGKAAAIHAIGDLATQQTVRVLGQLEKDGLRFPFVRMEHCQFIDLKTAREAKGLGVILSMQPNFNSDSVMYKDRLSAYYLETNNPFRMLIDKAGFVAGEDLIFGSDGMPHGAEAALKESLFPPFPQQKLSLEEFIAGYCMENQDHGYIEIKIGKDKLIGFSVSVKNKIIF
jgi:predicted amidohydrolase YtcJ